MHLFLLLERTLLSRARAVTQLNSDAEWPKVASVIHIFSTAPPRPSQRGQPLRGPSVLTAHSILLTDLQCVEHSRAHALLLTRVLSLHGGWVHFAPEHQHTLVLLFHITTLREILWHATKCEALVDMAVNVSPSAQRAFVHTLCSTQELKHVTLWRCAPSRFPFFLSCPRVGIATRCVTPARHKDLDLPLTR